MTYTPTPHLLVETDGPVTIITLNNPDQRNAFIDDIHDAMQNIWGDLSVDREVRLRPLYVVRDDVGQRNHC